MRLFRKRSSEPAGRRRLRQADDQAPSSATRRVSSEPLPPRDRRLAGQRDTPPKQSQARFWLQRTGLLILLVAIVVSLINVLSLSPHAKVLPVSSTNKSLLRDEATYQVVADKYLADSIWNRNKITIDTGRISKQMTATFPELADVSVAVPLLAHRPVVYLEPAQPALVLSASNGSYVLDTNGRALVSSGDLPSTKGLPQVADQSGLAVQLNHQVLPADDVRFIQTVSQQLAAKHIGIASMILPPTASELDVYIAKQPYFVKFSLRGDNPRQQVGTYLAALATLQRQHQTPSQYIDVRVDGRAYYK